MPENEAGFTLVDTLVATTIIAVVAALLPGAVSFSRQLNTRTTEIQETRLIADALLVDLLASGPKQGEVSGTTGGRAWRSTTRLVELSPGSDFALYRTTLNVQLNGARTLGLERFSYGPQR